MKINGIKIKKYRARVIPRNRATKVSDTLTEDGYKIVEGYVSIAAVNLPYGSNVPQYIPIFVAEEPDFNRMIFSGMGSTLMHPTTYSEGEYEILGEVE